MNLILLHSDDFIGPGRVALTGRRWRHVREVHRPSTGRELRVGVLNGRMGRGRVLAMDDARFEMEVTIDQDPPPPLPLTVVLALPRPKVLNRSVAMLASLGVKQIVLLNSWRVEKSYWNSPRLATENLRQQMLLGLEQGVDTALPEIRQRRFFTEFIEQDVPELGNKGALVLATPEGGTLVPGGHSTPLTLVVGPEGGFIADEISALTQRGFRPVSLGPRILRVETAIPYLIARLLR